ncbi:MAG: cation:proton antiporter [Chloroflexia bacterium]|nr:cation:proton antiporter [Chloroflexia bacterium]
MSIRLVTAWSRARRWRPSWRGSRSGGRCKEGKEIAFLTVEIDTLSIIGLIIVLAYLGSKGVQRIGIPQVVGFILVGVLLGSSFLNIVPISLVRELDFISEIALGLIGFDMGSHLRFDELRRLGRSIILILLGNSFGAFLLVAGGVYLVTRSIPMALILGALATATAPAATVDVLAEYRAKGPLTTTLLAVVGLDDALSLLLFSFAVVIAESLLLHAGGLPLAQMIGLPLLEIGGALLLGILVGAPFQWMLNRLKERHAVCAFIVGTVLFVAGLAETFNVSLILATMTMGVVVANLKSNNSQYAHCMIERVGPLAYILFFVLVGARLQISLLPQMGILGLAYLLLRAVGKFGGAWIGAWAGGAAPSVRNNLGFGLLSQAGVAVGLALSCTNRFQGYGEAGVQLANATINVITATTFVVQIIGPIMVKFAVTRAGEVGLGCTAEEPLPAEERSALESEVCYD